MPQDSPLPTSTTPSSFNYSPPPSSHHKHRPSLSNPMHWLSRTTSNSGSVSKGTIRHVEHNKPIRSIEILSPQRRGVLGAGATVVRTPDEALRDSSVRLTYSDLPTEEVSLPKPEQSQPRSQHQRLPSSDSLRGRLQERQHALRQQQQWQTHDAVEDQEATRSLSEDGHFEPITRISEQPQLEVDDMSVHSELPSPPYSPPLPALPISEPMSFVSEESSASSSQMPPRPSPHSSSQYIPPVPLLQARLKTAPQPISISRSTSSYSSDEIDVPPVSSTSTSVTLALVPPITPRPSFRAILLSEIPTSAIDPSKIIITLETSNSSSRTTLDTLCSRPSHLASYLNELMARNAREGGADRSSMYSVQSDDVSTYQHHLTGLGLLPQSSFSMHIFLDRPSAPYAYILHYLRSPVGTTERPETLPHPVRLPATPNYHASSTSRFDALLELRDEAHFLDLPHLVELCTEELSRYAQLSSRPLPALTTRSATPQKSHLRETSTSSSSGLVPRLAGSIHSMHASVHSLPESLQSSPDAVAKETELPHIMRKKRNTTTKSEVQPSSPPKAENKTVIATRGETTHGLRSPPTPQSWLGSQRSRSQSSNGSTRHLPPTPPAGWI